VPPRRLNASVPVDLQTICLKCLQKEQGKRYASAADLAADLRRFLADEPILARPVTRIERAVKWVRRRPAIAALWAAIAVVTALGLGGVFWEWRAAVASAGEARDQEKKALLARDEAEQARQKEADARSASDRDRLALKEERDTATANLYAARMSLAQSAWDSNNTGQVVNLLTQETSAPNATDLRGWEWHYLIRLTRGDLRTLRDPDAPRYAEFSFAAFGPDGRLVAAAGSDGAIRLWDSLSGQLRKLLGHHGQVERMAFSPDGKTLASAGWDGTVRLWNVADGSHRRITGHTSHVTNVAFHPTGRRLASIGDDATIKIWDASDGRLIRALGPVSWYSLAFSPDGTQLASADVNALKIWDTDSGRLSKEFVGQPSIRCVVFIPDGKRIAAGADDGTLKIWDVATGKELGTLLGHLDSILAVATSPDGRTLASTSTDYTVRLWDFETGAAKEVIRGHTNEVRSVAYSPDGRLLLTTGNDQMVKIWDARDRSNPHRLRGLEGTVRSVAFDPTGRYLATGDDRGSIQVWDTSTRWLVQAMLGGPKTTGLAFHPAGRWLASSHSDGKVRVWNLEDGQLLRRIKAHSGAATGLAFDSGGHLTTVGSDGLGRSWDIQGGRELPQSAVQLTGFAASLLNGHTPEFTAVSTARTGNRVAAAWGGAQVWDTKGGIVWKTTSTDEPLEGIALSPDGKRWATGSLSDFAVVRVWEIGTDRPVELRGHCLAIRAVAFSPDGERLASGGSEHTIRIWNVKNGLELVTLRGQSRRVHCLAFSPDGSQLASGGEDGEALLWDARARESPGEVERAEAIGLVEMLFDRFPDPQDVARAVAVDRTITEEVRSEAAELITPFTRSRTERRALDRVLALSADLLLVDDVVFSLCADPTLTEAERIRALELARLLAEQSIRRLPEALDIVLRRDATPASYSQAEAWAEEAAGDNPGDVWPTLTLAVAQYRTGHHREALETLERSRRLPGCPPAVHGYRALVHAKLGQLADSITARRRLETIAREPEWSENGWVKIVLEEVNESLGPAGGSTPARKGQSDH
jgi:WD40 repeat protein